MGTNIATITNSKVVSNEGQARRLTNRFLAELLKKKDKFSKRAVQLMLDHEGSELIDELFEQFRARVEQRVRIKTAMVTVDRDKTPEQLCKGLNREIYHQFDSQVLATLPRQGRGVEKVKLYFFLIPGQRMSCGSVAKELKLLGLEPDFYAQIQANVDSASYAYSYMNAMEWDQDKKLISSIFFGNNWAGPKGSRPWMSCERKEVLYGWSDGVWYCGREIRK